MVFCNLDKYIPLIGTEVVTILILIDGFLQFQKEAWADSVGSVTILILIDGFLQ